MPLHFWDPQSPFYGKVRYLYKRSQPNNPMSQILAEQKIKGNLIAQDLYIC